MPPWQPESAEGEFSGERRLEPGEIDTLRRWVEDGLQEGSPADRPAVPTYTEGWQLGAPDVVVTMPVPFSVPADGPDVFRNFVLPVPLDRSPICAGARVSARQRPRRCITRAFCSTIPVNSGRLDAKESAPGFPGMDVPGARFPEGHFLGWAPGKAATREAFPWPIVPGTDIVVQMHLKPTGRPETVRASIGLYLTDEAPARTPLMLRLGSKTIDIPADESHYEITDRFECRST